jgi:hypothetical protein
VEGNDEDTIQAGDPYFLYWNAPGRDPGWRVEQRIDGGPWQELAAPVFPFNDLRVVSGLTIPGPGEKREYRVTVLRDDDSPGAPVDDTGVEPPVWKGGIWAYTPTPTNTPTPTSTPAPAEYVFQSRHIPPTVMAAPPVEGHDVDSIAEGDSFFLYWNAPGREPGWRVEQRVDGGAWQEMTDPVWPVSDLRVISGLSVPVAGQKREYRVSVLGDNGLPWLAVDDTGVEPPVWKGGVMAFTQTPTATPTNTPTSTPTPTNTPTFTHTPTITPTLPGWIRSGIGEGGWRVYR